MVFEGSYRTDCADAGSVMVLFVGNSERGNVVVFAGLPAGSMVGVVFSNYHKWRVSVVFFVGLPAGWYSVVVIRGQSIVEVFQKCRLWGYLVWIY